MHSITAHIHFCSHEVMRILFCNTTSQDTWRNSEQGVSSGPAKEIYSAVPRDKALCLFLPTLWIPKLSPNPSLFTILHCIASSEKEL